LSASTSVSAKIFQDFKIPKILRFCSASFLKICPVSRFQEFPVKDFPRFPQDFAQDFQDSRLFGRPECRHFCLTKIQKYSEITIHLSLFTRILFILLFMREILYFICTLCSECWMAFLYKEPPPLIVGRTFHGKKEPFIRRKNFSFKTKSFLPSHFLCNSKLPNFLISFSKSSFVSLIFQ
jgi:hypothetical protein